MSEINKESCPMTVYYPDLYNWNGVMMDAASYAKHQQHSQSAPEQAASVAEESTDTLMLFLIRRRISVKSPPMRFKKMPKRNRLKPAMSGKSRHSSCCSKHRKRGIPALVLIVVPARLFPRLISPPICHLIKRRSVPAVRFDYHPAVWPLALRWAVTDWI